MADKLKRCPFCGGEAEYSTIDSSYVIPFGTIHHFVTCKNHCLEGLYSRGNTKEEAIEAWNNRPSPWHTGTPTEDGYYLCHVQFYSEYYESDEEGYDLPYWFENGSWEGNDENVRIIAWIPIEPYKKKKCKHCLGYKKNEIGEDVAFCEIWDLWRNVTLGDCFGNCEDEEY